MSTNASAIDIKRTRLLRSTPFPKYEAFVGRGEMAITQLFWPWELSGVERAPRRDPRLSLSRPMWRSPACAPLSRDFPVPTDRDPFADTLVEDELCVLAYRRSCRPKQPAAFDRVRNAIRAARCPTPICLSKQSLAPRLGHARERAWATAAVVGNASPFEVLAFKRPNPLETHQAGEVIERVHLPGPRFTGTI